MVIVVEGRRNREKGREGCEKEKIKKGNSSSLRCSGGGGGERRIRI